MPPDLECDVIVAAGDVGVGTQGVEWLKTLNKPVVYVAGNHEYWTKRGNKIDMFQVQRDIRKAAEGSNVIYLENEKVKIGDVEFIGATLWSNLGGYGYELAPGMIREARWMGDSCILCKEFYEDEYFNDKFFHLFERYLNVYREEKDFKQWMHDDAIKRAKKGEWHPIVSLILHNQSLSYITNSTKFDPENPDQKRVVVTHHHPSYKSLYKLKSNTEEQLSPKSRLDFLSGREPSGYLQAATYASDLEILEPNLYSTKLDKFSNQISHWLCGHLHHNLDYYQAGVRVSCNPRGRYRGPTTKESRLVSAFFGVRYSDDDVEERNRVFELNPFIGDNAEFNRHFIIDVDESIAPVFNREIELILPKLKEMLQDIKRISEHLQATNFDLLEIVFEKFNTKIAEFDAVTRKFSFEISQCQHVLSGSIDFCTDVIWQYIEFEHIDEKIAEKIRKRGVRAIELREWMINRIEEFKGLSFKELNEKLAQESEIKHTFGEFMRDHGEEFRGLSFKDINNKLKKEPTLKHIIPRHFYDDFNELDF